MNAINVFKAFASRIWRWKILNIHSVN
jgi:hypothetical protein